ncbi:alpha/beta fold hydrolase [Desulfosporosinus sp. BICA1-9]|uniref:alpha/beta fold hydrolase n=1 Tax=Desulfosporosinus sp. BICA1-9 TaxID=1531958 RepID=UPI00054C6AAF|nr:alpha/beta fold hydrolase [Desulfosporosinus sp. BICA1-9]KJS46095.1 MAG: hypothetical protein VR66_27370 [Peptococcaceae bacterium BRH_c23]KJS88532.1 MAG: hypothetical protein JL57_11980 [Desulfosporosinus sp. BICA1-9]HBW35143.1 lysophospholipase [Desulfosporosinus sp.]
MAVKEISFSSFNGRDTIKAWIYTPIHKPRAVVQVVHGFGEHSRRYLHMIGKMQEAGFVVCADDHVAHGKTAVDNNTWGDSGAKGYMTTIEDENTLRKMITDEYPDLPYFMFGHSWGSMIARGYAAHYGESLTGLILCGVVSQFSGAEILGKKDDMKKMAEAGRGGEDGSSFMAVAFADMTARYENPNSDFDWLATDPSVVVDYTADPFNNLSHPYTVQFFYDLIELYKYIKADDWASRVPTELPVYLIAGDQDPVCNYGEGLYHVANMLSTSGHKRVVTHCYTGKRHEIHNEPTIRDEVEKGIIDFIDCMI